MLALSPGRVKAQADSTLDHSIEAGEASVEAPKEKLLKWNEFDGSFFTLTAGAGLLLEAATFAQDDASRRQFQLESSTGIRDFRFLLKGSIKLERPTTWTCGIMYDGPSRSWFIRETGIMVAVDELWGHVFIGRTKEGFSLNKVMTGYANWAMERATINDATIPILADGIKWLGYFPGHKWLYTIGWYTDWLSDSQSFTSYENQFIARLVWLPIASEQTGKLLHLGINGRYGIVDDGMLRLRSRPELFLSPYFIDTGSFVAHHTTMGSVDAYYRMGPLLLGSEYFVQRASSSEAGSPVFHGGDVALCWLITGETRAYSVVGGFFKTISPSRSFFDGGPGAWEAVLRFSYIDLDSGLLDGGKFWRLTSMVNWHLSGNVRMEFVYGFGSLDRFGELGGTHFFQTRLQTLI